jgi:FKBP-type peptidyl-prolyl cis-trans isomerase
MKKVIITLMLPLCAFSALAQTKKTTTTTTKKTTVTRKAPVKAAPVSALKSALDSASYAFGTSMGGNLKGNGVTHLNYDLLIKGLKDTFEGKTPALSSDKSQAAIMKIIENASKQKFSGNIAAGKTFLEQNKKQAGVKVTPSGLQYIVVKEGQGIKPTATDTVLVHYTGTLLDGKKFDSSYDRNEPLSLPLNGVIKGWTEGVQLMTPGSKYKFFIPYQMAYGERGAGQDIPPYSTLIFDIELLKVNGK